MLEEIEHSSNRTQVFESPGWSLHITQCYLNNYAVGTDIIGKIKIMLMKKGECGWFIYLVIILRPQS